MADKPDSQDICFVPEGGYARIVEKLRPEAAEPGEIVDLEGRVMGRHEGIIGYTIGQRKGLGIGGRKDSTDPLYVVRLEPETRRVVIGPRDALACGRCGWASSTGWATADPGRGHGGPGQAALHHGGRAGDPLSGRPSGAEAVLDDPAHGVSPGQACVSMTASACSAAAGSCAMWPTRRREGLDMRPTRNYMPRHAAARLTAPRLSPYSVHRTRGGVAQLVRAGES